MAPSAAACRALADPVEHDREDDDGERRPRSPCAMLTVLSARTTGLPRPSAPTSAAITTIDRRQHDALGDAGHDRRQRVGQLDLEQELALGRAERLAGLDELRRHRRDAEMGQPDRRRHGEDHGRDQARHRAEAEQDQGRDQVDEGRDRLHQVEDRPHRRVEPRPVRGGDAERHADERRRPASRRCTSDSVSIVACQ